MKYWRFVLAAALAWATYELAPARHASFRTLAAVVLVAIGAGVSFLLAVDAWIGDRRSVRSAQIEEVVRFELEKIYQANLLPNEFHLISFHVWEVPLAYRRLVPYKARRFLHDHLPEKWRRWSLRP